MAARPDREAQDWLDDEARRIAERLTTPVGTVVLFGEPRTALQHYAGTHGYELIVSGSHTLAGSRLGTSRVSR